MLVETTLKKGAMDKSMVLVTGATGGLGKAFAVECASRGWDVFLTDLQPDLLEALAAGLRNAYGVRVITHTSDLTDPASRAGLFARLHGERLRFWGLINVAGIDFEGPFFEQTSHQIQTIIRLNVEGTLEMIRGLLELRDPLSTFRIIQTLPAWRRFIRCRSRRPMRLRNASCWISRWRCARNCAGWEPR